MSQHGGHTDENIHIAELAKSTKVDLEKLYAISGIINKNAEANLRLQEQALNLLGNTKEYKIAYATGTSGTIMTLFAGQNKFIQLVSGYISWLLTADGTISFNIIDRGGTARVFIRHHIDVTFLASGIEELDFHGTRLDHIEGTGATYNVMPEYCVEPGDGRTPRFSVSMTGTGTVDATIVYYETEASTY